MSEIANRYQEVHAEFDSLIQFAVALIEKQTGHLATDDRQFYGERIFGKLVCHALTLRKLSPAPTPAALELWDISSSYAIARTLIESFDALAYISLESVAEPECSLRVLLWKLHAEERRKEMLRRIGSTHPEANAVAVNVDQLRRQALLHSHIAILGPELRKKVEKGETPPYYLSGAERDKRNGVDHDYHVAITMHLSSHVHTHPFSIHQLFEFQAGNDECLRLMSVPLQYSTGFLAKATAGMIELFAPRVPQQSPELSDSLRKWRQILASGIRNLGRIEVDYFNPRCNSYHSQRERAGATLPGHSFRPRSSSSRQPSAPPSRRFVAPAKAIA